MVDVKSIQDFLESKQPEVIQEVKQLIYEQYAEVRDPWLVNGLFDYYITSGSARCLELLLNVRDPHDKFLCDKITEGLRHPGGPRSKGLAVLGYIIRKQPSWLYRVTQHGLMKELFKVLKTEENIEVLLSGLLDLLALMPILPVYIVAYIPDIFEVFSRVALWKYQCFKSLPEIHQIHLHVTLFAFFHRLYGMFPCSFLHFLRSRYSANNKSAQAVYAHSIEPMLNTVRLHPFLVTQNREYEKTPVRWKKMELHDVIVESSRYALLNEESTKEGDVLNPAEVINMAAADQNNSSSSNNELIVAGITPLDALWTPGRKFDLKTPPPPPLSLPQPQQPQPQQTTRVTAMMSIVTSETLIPSDSPPEAAIEATPDTTPFVTPSKEEFRYQRPAPSPAISRSLRLDIGSVRSPGSPIGGRLRSGGGCGGGGGTSMSPMKQESSPFPFPPSSHYDLSSSNDLFLNRRDSLFDHRGGVQQLDLPNRLTKLGLEHQQQEAAAESTTPKRPSPIKFTSEASKLGLECQQEAAADSKFTTPKQSTTPKRPSPIKFTSEVSNAIKPEPQRPQPHPPSTPTKSKTLLSLDSFPDFVVGTKDGTAEDDEVTKLMGGGGSDTLSRLLLGGAGHPMTSSSSVATSETISVPSSQNAEGSSVPTTILAGNHSVPCSPSSSSGDNDDDDGDNEDEDDEDQRGLPDETVPASSSLTSSTDSSSVNEFMRQIRGRMRYISLCGGQAGGAICSSSLDECPNGHHGGGHHHRRRFLSCPDPRKMDEIIRKRPKKLADFSQDVVRVTTSSSEHHATTDLTLTDEKREDVSTQTDEYVVFPYEHLFPSVLPQVVTSTTGQQQNGGGGVGHDDNPYILLDRYLNAIYSSDQEKKLGGGKDEKKILRSELMMLHNQLLYERYRREILGLRNRRLLGKTKSSRILEEENNALKDQLQLVKSEIEDLHRQLERLRREKHLVEEERATTTKNRDEEIEKKLNENRSLKIIQQKLEEQIIKQEKEINKIKKQLDLSEAQRFSAKANLEVLEQKENERKVVEMELLRLRKESLRMGELQRKYSEQLLNRPQLASFEAERELLSQAYEQKMALTSKNFEAKTNEIESYKWKVLELEGQMAKKDSIIADQKLLIKRIQDENLEIQKEAKSTYESMVQIHAQTEGQILELRDHLALHTKVLSHQATSTTGVPPRTVGGTSRSVPVPATTNVAPPSSGKKMAAVSRFGGMIQTKNLDIETTTTTTNEAIGGGGCAVDRSFVVGSPPLSSEGSLGSDKSEIIRRTLESTQPINFGEEEKLPPNSPPNPPPAPQPPLAAATRTTTTTILPSDSEVGSAVSAKEIFGSSLNGKH